MPAEPERNIPDTNDPGDAINDVLCVLISLGEAHSPAAENLVGISVFSVTKVTYDGDAR